MSKKVEGENQMAWNETKPLNRIIIILAMAALGFAVGFMLNDDPDDSAQDMTPQPTAEVTACPTRVGSDVC